MAPEIYFPNLNIKIEQLDRCAFTVFGVEIYWYGILIAIGVLLALHIALLEAKRTGQNPDVYSDFLVFGVLMGVAGARLYYVLFNENTTLLDFFRFRDGGLGIYGGVIGGVLAVVIYTRRIKYSLPIFCDTGIRSLVLGQMIGRWGNFINREAFGRASGDNNPLALRYLAEDISGLKINGNEGIYNGAIYPIIEDFGEKYIQVHPTFLYESLWNLALLILLYLIRDKKTFDGEIFLYYFVFYGIGRFWIESLRTDQLMLGPFPVSMLLSSILVVIATTLIIIFKNKAKKKL